MLNPGSLVHRLELGPRAWIVHGDVGGVEAFLAAAGVYRWQLSQFHALARSGASQISFRRLETSGSTQQLEVLTQTDGEVGTTLSVSAPTSHTGDDFHGSSFRVAETAWRETGLFPIHSAGLVTPQGRGILFVGASGTGKTTLTIRLVQEGWRYLSDDGVGIETGFSGVLAWGLRRIFTVAEKDLDPRFLGEHSSPIAPVRPEADPKHAVFADVMFPNAFVPSVRPSVVVFLDRSELSDPSLEPRPLSRREALARLIENVTWPENQTRVLAGQLEALRDLSAQCEHFSLNYRAHAEPETLSARFAAL